MDRKSRIAFKHTRIVDVQDPRENIRVVKPGVYVTGPIAVTIKKVS